MSLSKKLVAGLVLLSLMIVSQAHPQTTPRPGPPPVGPVPVPPYPVPNPIAETVGPRTSQAGPTVNPAPSILPGPGLSGNQNPAFLRSEAESLARERAQAAREARDDRDPLAEERAKLRGQLLELIKRLGDRRLPRSSVVITPRPESSRSVPEPVDIGRPVDAVRAAQNLFRAKDYDAALRAFRAIDLSTLSREDRAFVQYMTACSLRKLGRLSEAAVLYRDIAEAREDDFVTECALWQIGTIRWTQDLESQLEEMRARRKSP